MPTETETIEARFRGFAEFSPSPLYRSLSGGVAGDPEITGMMLEAAPDQRWPMLLLAAVHLQARRVGERYPGDPESLLALCRAHREPLLETIRARSTETNEVARCNYLLPCFAAASDGRPLALVEVGASRGLLLNIDRYAYRFSGEVAGDPGSALSLSCELRGKRPPLRIPPVDSRGRHRPARPAATTSGCGPAPSPTSRSGIAAARRRAGDRRAAPASG